RRGAEIDHAPPGFQKPILVVHLDQLVGGARAKALALGARHVGIVELALEPQPLRQRAALAGAQPHLEVALTAAAATLLACRAHNAPHTPSARIICTSMPS